MKKVSKKFVFTRSEAIELGGLTVKSCRRTLGIDRIQIKNLKLVRCGASPDGTTSIQSIRTNREELVPVDLELMNYLTMVPDLFSYLLEKEGILGKKEAIIMCTGSTLFENGIAKYKVFLYYKAGQRELEVNTVGVEFKGILPETYQLVYQTPCRVPIQHRNVA